jgi:acyl-CoA synthetase (NDP forming)
MSTVTTQDLGQDFPARAAARLGPLFAPRGIAVIGASRDPAKLGAAMTRSLAGFAGTVAGINPRDADPQAGRYRSVAEAAAMTGAPIDLAILCVPASRSASALAEAAEALTAAVLALVDDARAQFRQHSAHVPARHRVTPAGPLDEDQAKTLLGVLGAPTPPRRPCRDRAEAHQALTELPGPVAVKILDAGVAHKSDIGGVHLGIRDPAGLDAALDALDRAGARRYLIETMAPPGLDLIAGASRDPVFGPVVLVGQGGTIAEALGDVAVALAPLTPAQAAALLDEIAGRALLDGFRGGPVADRDAIGEVLTALGDLLIANPMLETAEINPLRVTGQGLLALDAVVTFRDGSAPREADHHA